MPEIDPTENDDPRSFLRNSRHKLIEFFDGNRGELNDLHAALGEQKNLAADIPDKTPALLNKLHTWSEQTSAPLPLPIQ